MDNRAEKISLLSEMIALALVDGELHDKEFDFLSLLALQLGIEKPAFMDLFRKRDKLIFIKDEFQRILHFYKLSLLMYSDNFVHEYEDSKIHEIGIKMGLNPIAMDKVLSLMKTSENHIVEPNKIINIFQKQYN
jgi:hypothetical protein